MPTAFAISNDAFQRLWNQCSTVAEVAGKTNRPEESVSSKAKNLRRIGYRLKRMKNGRPPGKKNAPKETAKPEIDPCAIHGWSIRVHYSATALGATKAKVIYRKGPHAATVAVDASFVVGFVRSEELKSYTREQWLDIFGEGRL